MDTTQDPNTKKNKKKDKVRSAWISFAGRIVAQLVGAIATVSLGVMMLHRYTASDPQPPVSESAPQPSVIVVFISPETTQPDGEDEHARPADRAARQAEMARAIARAVSATIPAAH